MLLLLYLINGLTFLYKPYTQTQKKETFPRRQVNKPLPIRPKRTAVQFPIKLYHIPPLVSMVNR